MSGRWDGEIWVEESGYMVDRKWVLKYPSLFGPNAKDPDEGQGDVELDDFISRLLSKYTGAGGTFSTWNERHAFIIYAGIGYNDVLHEVDVPPVAEFFIKEAHYCIAGLTMGRAAKKIEEATSKNYKSLGIVAAIMAAIGTVVGPKILSLIGWS